MTNTILMNNQEIVKFARENNISPAALRLAAHTLSCENIKAKLEKMENKEYNFVEGNWIPRVVCTAFDEAEEVLIRKAYIDENNQLRFEIEDFGCGENYDVSHAELECMDYIDEYIIVKQN